LCQETRVTITHNTVQHSATHCNTLQHTATHCNTLQHTATWYNTLHRTTTQESPSGVNNKPKSSHATRPRSPDFANFLIATQTSADFPGVRHTYTLSLSHTHTCTRKHTHTHTHTCKNLLQMSLWGAGQHSHRMRHFLGVVG